MLHATTFTSHNIFFHISLSDHNGLKTAELVETVAPTHSDWKHWLGSVWCSSPIKTKCQSADTEQQLKHSAKYLIKFTLLYQAGLPPLGGEEVCFYKPRTGRVVSLVWSQICWRLICHDLVLIFSIWATSTYHWLHSEWVTDINRVIYAAGNCPVSAY